MTATANPYFLYPFAIDSSSLGSGSVIPNTGASTGAMSYEYGFTINYEQDLQTVSTALPIPRNQFNQLMFDITTALQQLQTYGAPNWVSVGDGGPATGYPLNATVLYNDGNIYQSQVATNTATPGTDQSWLITSGQANSVPIGTIIDYAGVSAPYGYILCDGSAVSRTVTYAQLFSAIVAIQSCTTINTSANLTVVNSTQMYAGMPIEGAGIQAGTTISSITNGTTIVMSQTATASATVPVNFFNWGNGDGSTTFNLPSLSGTVLAGADAAGYATSSILTQMVVGNDGGLVNASFTMAGNQVGSHSHTATSTVTTTLVNAAGVDGNSIITGGFTGGTGSITLNPSVTVASSAAPSAPVSVLQPTALTYKCIKYI